MQRLYTFGYLNSKAERIINELITVHTPIVDVRFNPTSKRHTCTQEGFKARTGIIYFHIVELGNELYREALTGQFTEPHIKLSAPEQGIAKLQGILDTYGRAAIFCACASCKNCHRKTVAELASSQLGVQIVHL